MKPIPIEPSFAAWRRVARSLLQAAVEPHEIEWIECIDVTVPAWNENKNIPPAVSAETPVPEFKISRELLSALEAAAGFRAPNRWSLLYRILWRWSHGERAARSPEDPDGALLDERIKAVEREAHEMETRTRFRRRDPSLGPPELVGWYEPRHDVLERTAARLAKRTGYATWVVATPHGAAFWDGTLLRVARPAEEGTPSRTVSDDPVGEADTGDAPEALWLAHYAHAFARGSGRPHAAAQPVVPLRYWKAPPEGLPAAPRRAAHAIMLRRSPSKPSRKTNATGYPSSLHCRCALRPRRSPRASAAAYGATPRRRSPAWDPRRPRSCSSANSRENRTTATASHSAAPPASCSTRCWRARGSIMRRCI